MEIEGRRTVKANKWFMITLWSRRNEGGKQMDGKGKPSLLQENERKSLLKFHRSFQRRIKDLMRSDCVVDCK
jgi:hypothetical protein